MTEETQIKEKKPNKFSVAFHGFARFLYNGDDHTVMGRGANSWGKILVFYFFFYAALAGFFAVCLYVMLTTLDPNKPTVYQRTNKPVLAIDDPGMFTINFKDENAFGDYKTAAKELKKRYSAANNNASETDKKFTWDSDTLGECADVENNFKNTAGADEKVACFYMGLNRIYGYEPPIEEDATDKDLSFKCELDKGRTGAGNMDPPFDPKTGAMMPAAANQKLKKHYPWYRLEDEGRQPLVGLKITWKRNLADQMDDGASLYSYFKCHAKIRTGDTFEDLPDARPVDFTVKFG